MGSAASHSPDQHGESSGGYMGIPGSLAQFSRDFDTSRWLLDGDYPSGHREGTFDR